MPFAPDAPGVGAPPFNALPPPFIVDATAVGKGEDDVDDVVGGVGSALSMGRESKGDLRE